MATKKIVSELKKMITTLDKNVTSKKGLIMKKDGIVFMQDGVFKYGIDSTETRVTLHLMPMYANSNLRDKYAKKLNDFSFAKGCIKFNPAKELDLSQLESLIKDCSKEKFPCK